MVEVKKIVGCSLNKEFFILLFYLERCSKDRMDYSFCHLYTYCRRVLARLRVVQNKIPHFDEAKNSETGTSLPDSDKVSYKLKYLILTSWLEKWPDNRMSNNIL